MNAPTVEELTRFIRFLGHERFAIKSVQTGKKGAREAHFDLINANKAVDYIGMRNGKRQIWTNVQRLKKNPEKFHTHLDVEAYANIFIDIDAKKPDDRKDYAATKRERGFALAQLPTVRAWLDGQGFKPGLAFESGNGAGLLLPIPPTPPTPEFIAKVAAFLKMVKREANVDVDTTTFDPPRVCGILGTWNSKFEDEAEGRKNHLREVIGEIPQRDEDEKLLEFIEGLTPDPDALREWTKKFNSPPTTEENEPEPPEDAGEVDVDFVKAKLDALSEADTVLLDLLNWTDEAKKRHGKDRSKAEFGLVGKLAAGGFTDPQINWIMAYISKIGKWVEEGEHYQRLTLRKIRAKDAEEAAEDEGEGEGAADPERLRFKDLMKTVTDEETGKKRRQRSVTAAATSIISKYKIISTPDGLIWVYDVQEGIWKPNGKNLIAADLDHAGNDVVNITFTREVTQKVFLRTLDETEGEIFNVYPDLFPVENGVVDMRKGVFMEHDPKFMLTWKAPVRYDKRAKSPVIDQFMEDVFDETGRKTFMSILAAKTTRHVFEFFSPWIGHGSNGKNRCIDLIRAFWGDSRISEVEITGLSKNRFDLVQLKDKDFVINSEISGKKAETDWIKRLTGNTVVTADRKNLAPVQFRPHCFYVADCNKPPRFDDTSYGFERRIAPISFNTKFVDDPDPRNPRERKRDPHITQKITKPEELSGLLNRLIEIAPEVIETMTIYRGATGEKIVADYDMKAQSAEYFWDLFMIGDYGKILSTSGAHTKYKEFCDLVGALPVHIRDFNAVGISQRFEKTRFKTPDGENLRVWNNTSFDEEAWGEFILSRKKNQVQDRLEPDRTRSKSTTGPDGPDKPPCSKEKMDNNNTPQNVGNVVGDGVDPVHLVHVVPLSIPTRSNVVPSGSKDQVRSGEKAKDDGVFGKSRAYYLQVGGGQIPTIKQLMDDIPSEWTADKAKMAIHLLEEKGESRGFNAPLD